MKYVLFGHAGSANHGCEAIVRSTCKMFGKNEYYLQSGNWLEDLQFNINDIVRPIFLNENEIDRNSFKGLLFRTKSRLSSKYDFDDLVENYNNKALLKKHSVALSIGGDNYCYSGIISDLRSKLKTLQRKHIPTVLWGCSLDKKYFYKETIQDLARYDLITVRDSLSLQNLYEIGIRDNVISCADPAFTLDIQETEVNSEFFEQGEVVGLNVSDFMQYYNAYSDATFRNFKKLIEFLLDKTNYNIALIPHVRQVGNDDLIPSTELLKCFDSNRIAVVKENLNCMQLKYLISKCKMFIGCRTHATIAAYSTCIPTLVVGYSIKAKGIAKDILGDCNGLVVDGREFQSDDDLTKAYIKFSEREREIKNRLTEFMPEYIKRAYNGKIAAEELFNR